MILGTGVDVIEVERIRQAIARWGDRFLHRVFTPREIQYCLDKSKPERSFAVRFAAKEAVMKALGRGPRGGVRWTGLEVLNLESGAPEIRSNGRAADLMAGKRVLISLSHVKELAVAMALLVQD